MSKRADPVAALLPIRKKTLRKGDRQLKRYAPQTKFFFHYQTLTADDDTLIDDSRKLFADKPFELVTGKEFKIEFWDRCLQTMVEGEMAEFTAPADMCVVYPIVSKQIRHIASGHEEAHCHTCCGGMNGTTEKMTTGFPDLDQLVDSPQSLRFIFDVLHIQRPGEFEKEPWLMSAAEKREAVETYHTRGNALYIEGRFEEASDMYAKAVGVLDQLSVHEKPGTPEYLTLQARRRPLLLNYAQTLLKAGEHYAVIEHLTTVLNDEPENVKALYRRGIAHARVWNHEEAVQDLTSAAALDPSLERVVKKELAVLAVAKRERNEQDKAALRGKLFSDDAAGVAAFKTGKPNTEDSNNATAAELSIK